MTETSAPPPSPVNHPASVSRLGLLPLLILGIIVSGFPVEAAAEPADRRVAAITHENDVFANRDEFYTSGVRVSWFSRQDEIPVWVRWFSQHTGLYDPEAEQRMSYTFGQNLYTPLDISQENPDPEDRPYGGWLYGSVGHIQAFDRVLEAYELQFGIVGPSAQGEEVQKQIHKLFGSEVPAGWDHQLRDEVGIRVTYGQTRLVLDHDVTRSTRIQWFSGWAASLGNIQTSAQLSGGVRWGNFSNQDYGPPLIRSFTPGSGYYTLVKPVEWYTYLHLAGRYVVHEIFLDGNTLHEGPEVDREPWLGEAQIGAVVSWSSYRISYTHVFPTREFESQRRTDDYGAVTVSLRF